MYVVNNCSRALPVAPIPLAAAHAVVTVIATDPRAPVGADDPARHRHRVIPSN